MPEVETQARLPARVDATASQDLPGRLNVVARRLTLAVVLAGAGLAAFLHLYSQRFGALVSVDAVDSAQIALRLLHHRELGTDVQYPFAMVNGDTQGADIRQGPLYPAILAVFFMVRGVSDGTVALCNGLLHLLTAWALFGLLKRLYDHRVAILGVLAYVISMEATGQALTASPVTTAALFVTLGVLAAARMVAAEGVELPESPGLAGGLQRLTASPLAWAGVLGLVLGLAYLTGVVAGLALLAAAPAAVLALSKPRRWKALGIVLVCMLVVIGPWFARNLSVFRTPVPPLTQAALIMHTETFPGESVLWAVDSAPDPLTFALTHPLEMGLKFINGLTVLYRQIPQVVNIYLFPLVLWGGLLMAKRSTEERVVWHMLGALVLLQALALGLADFDYTALRIVTALATGLAVATLVALARARLRRPLVWAVAGAAILVLVFPYAASVGLGPRSGDPSTANPGAIRTLSEQRPDIRVASDRPWHVVWYGEHPSLLLPDDLQGLDYLAARFPAFAPIDIVYLSHQRGAMGGREYWLQAARGEGEAAAQAAKRWPALLPMQGDELILMPQELRGVFVGPPDENLRDAR